MDRLLEEVWADRGLAEKYRFERHIATSSMGVVVAARHLELEERVAIKFLSPDAVRSNTAVSRFRGEAKAAAKIKSQHVVRIIDVATTTNNVPYIVMEHLDGKDLEQVLAQFPSRRAPVRDAIDFILQASEAVCEGHSLGIVHRDLKPANLFCIDRGDGYPLIKVLDFGISKFTTPVGSVERTDRYEILGSPRYMSPEQIESASNVDHKTDIWSLGVILYEALAGKPPFDDELILALWRKIKEDAPEPISAVRAELPPGVSEIVNKCLRKNPRERFTDLGQFARALAPFAPDRSRVCIARILWLAERAHTATEHTSLFTDSYDRVPTSPMRQPRRLLLASGITATIALGVGLLVTRSVQERPLAKVSYAIGGEDSATRVPEPASNVIASHQRFEVHPTAADIVAPPTVAPIPPAKSPKTASPRRQSGSGRLVRHANADLATATARTDPAGAASNPSDSDGDSDSDSDSDSDGDTAEAPHWLMQPVKERK